MCAVRQRCAAPVSQARGEVRTEKVCTLGEGRSLGKQGAVTST